MVKKRNPKVNLPSYVKDIAMLSPRRDGKIDRKYINLMCDAIHTYEKHKNNNIKIVNRDHSSEE